MNQVLSFQNYELIDEFIAKLHILNIELKSLLLFWYTASKCSTVTADGFAPFDTVTKLSLRKRFFQETSISSKLLISFFSLLIQVRRIHSYFTKYFMYFYSNRESSIIYTSGPHDSRRFISLEYQGKYLKVTLSWLFCYLSGPSRWLTTIDDIMKVF